MNTNTELSISETFLPMVGQLVWSVRRGYGTSLTLEFGMPHRIIREPILSSRKLSDRVQKIVERRQVTIIGDYHLLIQNSHWRINTKNYVLNDNDEKSVIKEKALTELDGQTLLSVDDSNSAGSVNLKFDLDGLLTLWPNLASSGDQWSIYELSGQVTSCEKDGRIIRITEV